MANRKRRRIAKGFSNSFRRKFKPPRKSIRKKKRNYDHETEFSQTSRKQLNTERVSNYWKERAYTAGYQAATAEESSRSVEKEMSPYQQVNKSWNHWYHSVKPLPWPVYYATAAKFAEGYCKHSKVYFGNRVLLPTDKTVAAIVMVMNEKDTILQVIEQLHRMTLHEIIFVVNGSTDESFEMIRNQSNAIIVHYQQALGHDVGRAIGAKLADSDILLFLDGDFPVLAEHLVPFIDAVERGMDIALNNISPYIGLFSGRDYVTTVKEFINRSMSREDLEANSLTAVPHAMRKEAARIIGYGNLAVPPKAQVIAMEKGLSINAPASVDVITRNRLRTRNVGPYNSVSDMIIGDHIEALKTVIDLKGPRLSFPDQIRHRQITKV
ncbi:Glycosyltransferases involved in cell wall biogenesis [Paenibacillus uliginis N3/975]|uniref:Glycosyltransferases involved in cell wall biogenesis n=1 Tax=Paenibacillus uliginis N3/975 TaxID=1313296 RepID=A0A1X7HND8_9BACL|nr:glycosyltransferase family A protein [Paenibacillus uliginis]SMF89444.1 Glycosyltransferases involved in cell wall biogenesis [Paenibacillus uliginis N3/975]